LRTTIFILKYILLYFLLCAGTFLMLRGILEYASFREDVGFLQFKQEYLPITIWKIAFYTHVFSSILTLMAGFTQFSGHILQEHRTLHRILGRIYAWDILLINFPAGMIMAFYANGHWPSKIAFIILDSLWFYFTLRAVLEARRKNIAAHRRFMIRSYALTCSAIGLRTWKIILSHAFHPDPLTLYMIDAWMGFVPNLLFAEWWIRRRSWKKAQPQRVIDPRVSHRQ
jgi:uncharacterized membrane protein